MFGLPYLRLEISSFLADSDFLLTLRVDMIEPNFTHHIGTDITVYIKSTNYMKSGIYFSQFLKSSSHLLDLLGVGFLEVATPTGAGFFAGEVTADQNKLPYNLYHCFLIKIQFNKLFLTQHPISISIIFAEYGVFVLEKSQILTSKTL